MAVDPLDPRPLDPRPLDPRPIPEHRESKSIPDLFGDLLRETTDLFRTEGQLIRAEISDKITKLEVGGGSIAAGAICLLVSLIVLSGALVAAIAKIGEPDLGAGWAALIVGLLIAGIGVALLMKGKKDLDPANLTPERSANQLRKDTQLVKEQVR